MSKIEKRIANQKFYNVQLGYIGSFDAIRDKVSMTSTRKGTADLSTVYSQVVVHISIK